MRLVTADTESYPALDNAVMAETDKFKVDIRPAEVAVLADSRSTLPER